MDTDVWFSNLELRLKISFFGMSVEVFLIIVSDKLFAYNALVRHYFSYDKKELI